MELVPGKIIGVENKAGPSGERKLVLVVSNQPRKLDKKLNIREVFIAIDKMSQ